jgi:hypothetical protein
MAYEIVFRRGEQSQTYEELRTREIQPTRYADEFTLNELGLLYSVNYLLDNLKLNYFLSQKNHVYAQLTLEFLSSLIVSTIPETRSSSGTLFISVCLMLSMSLVLTTWLISYTFLMDAE